MKIRSLFSFGLCLYIFAGAAEAQRLQGVAVSDKKIPRVQARFGSGDGSGGLAGTCSVQTSSHTNASFEGGAYVGQGGFAEQEVAAVSYTLSPSDFPIKIELIEKIFGTDGRDASFFAGMTAAEWHKKAAEGLWPHFPG